jgi:flagellar biosynthesis GTPase FlhF
MNEAVLAALIGVGGVAIGGVINAFVSGRRHNADMNRQDQKHKEELDRQAQREAASHEKEMQKTKLLAELEHEREERQVKREQEAHKAQRHQDRTLRKIEALEKLGQAATRLHNYALPSNSPPSQVMLEFQQHRVTLFAASPLETKLKENFENFEHAPDDQEFYDTLMTSIAVELNSAYEALIQDEA